MNIIKSDFTSRGTRCAGRLYLPEGGAKAPVVVMAHGLAAEMAFGLESYAQCFAKRGMAVFMFDYRCFGESDGEPRNLVIPRRHLADWASAVAHVRGLSQVDVSRMALWGSSFSGGHVIVTAARTPGIAAVVAQVPFVDGIASSLIYGPMYMLKAFLHGTLDIMRMMMFLGPHYVPVVGSPDEFAVMNTLEAKPGYLALVPKGSSWKNRCPARIFFTLPLYRPVRHARRVSVPALIVPAVKDSLLPYAAVRKLLKKLPAGEEFATDAGHFDPYPGAMFDRVVEVETAFLERYLLKK